MAGLFPPDKHFEWLLEVDQLNSLLASLVVHLSPEGDSVVVVPGCGMSRLSNDLTTLGFGKVVSIDNDPTIIHNIKLLHPEIANTFHCADVLAASVSSVVADRSSDMVIDKCCIDCLLCNDLAAHKLCANVHTMLKEGGRYVVISLHEMDFLVRFLSLYFVVERTEELTRVGEQNVRVLVLKKVRGLGENHERCVEEWYTMAAPLLTEEREAEIRQGWDDDMMELRRVYELIFSDLEKEEYKFADFQGDAREFGGGSQVGGVLLWTVEDGLGFLREMQ